MAYKPPIHGRDHCPTGSDPIPCLTPATFKAWQSVDFNAGAGQSISNGTTTILTWDLWSNSNDAVFDIMGATTSLTQVRIIPWGRYSFHCIVAYFDNFAADCSVGMNVNGYGTWPIAARTIDQAATLANAGGLVFHDELVLPPPDVENEHAVVGGSGTPTDNNPNNVGTIEFIAIQSSGISRSTSWGCEMTIMYHGPEPEPGELQGSGAP